MKILLIEDDSLKSDRILDFLSDNFSGSSVDLEKSYQSGLKAAISGTFDLALLDMTLPTFDVSSQRREGRSRTMGGRELLGKLRLKKIELPVVIITQFGKFGEGADAITFDELMEQCAEDFPELFMGGVSYRASTDSWKSDLKQLINNVAGKIS